MVERFKDTRHPVFKSISALSRRILKNKNNRDTIHFNADASNIELFFQTTQSVNQLSIYGAVSIWCKQLGVKKEATDLERPLARKEPVTKGVLSSVNPQEVKLLVSSPRPAWETVCRKTLRTSNPCLRQSDLQGYAKTQFLRFEFQLV